MPSLSLSNRLSLHWRARKSPRLELGFLAWGVLCLILLLLTGCIGGTAKLINAAAKDPASVHLTVKSIYATVEYDRTNPGTNSAPHTVKDGAITVK